MSCHRITKDVHFRLAYFDSLKIEFGYNHDRKAFFGSAAQIYAVVEARIQMLVLNFMPTLAWVAKTEHGIQRTAFQSEVWTKPAALLENQKRVAAKFDL